MFFKGLTVRKRNIGAEFLCSDNNIINKALSYNIVIFASCLSSELSALNQTISSRFTILCNKPQSGMPLAILSVKNLIHGKDRKFNRERSVF